MQPSGCACTAPVPSWEVWKAVWIIAGGLAPADLVPAELREVRELLGRWNILHIRRGTLRGGAGGRGYSADEVAAFLGVPASSVLAWEEGRALDTTNDRAGLAAWLAFMGWRDGLRQRRKREERRAAGGTDARA